MSAHGSFRTNQLLPLRHMQPCIFNVREGRLCLSHLDDERRHSELTPIFFPASRVPCAATEFKLAVALLFVGYNKKEETCILMMKDENGVLSLPLVKVQGGETLLDACHAYVHDWVRHDWWFKQLASIELVPAADQHILLIVHGQCIGPIISPGRRNYHWISEERILKMKNSTEISSDFYEFIHSPIFSSWCSLNKLLY
jgi:hypothetical protein